MNRTPHIVFRCDGNSGIGLGHIYRCIAFAGFLHEKFGTITFVVRESSNTSVIPSAYKVAIISRSCALADEPAFLTELFSGENVIVVLDGYAFDAAYVQAIHRHFKTVYVDDLHAFKIHADLVINHTGGFTRNDFKTLPLTRLCIGTDYAILRKEFLARRDREHLYDVMICFGGADPQNHTAQVLAGFTKNEKIALVIGSAYAFRADLKLPANVTVFENLDAEHLADVMASSRAAVTSASTVAYEYLAVSTGNLFIVQTADNQKHLAAFLVEQGAAKFYTGQPGYGWSSRNLVDGRSGERLVKELIELEKQLYVELRTVEASDLEMVFDWTNDPEVRAQSYNAAPVLMEDHVRWFNAKMAERPTFYYILSSEKGDLGQIRFTVSGTEAVLGFLVAPKHRGMGWGSIILKNGIERFMKDAPAIKTISGYVKRSNPASQKSFLKCNFREEITTDYPDSFKYTLQV